MSAIAAELQQDPADAVQAPVGRRWLRFRRSLSAWVGGAVVLMFVLMALLADWISPYSPDKLIAKPYLNASADHWLGTDHLGRDILARVVYGSRLSLAAGVIAISLAIAVGAPLGAIAGYLGGWLDLALMRLIDIMLSLPSILLALLLVVASEPSHKVVLITIAFINMPVICRQVRATVLSVRHQDYVLASRAAGASVPHILWHVVLPAIVSPVIVLGTLGLGTAILEVAGLSFLGVSGQPDAAEWGAMLSAAKDSLNRAPSCTWLAPGLAITLAVLGFSLLGDGLRDALEPTSR